MNWNLILILSVSFCILCSACESEDSQRSNQSPDNDTTPQPTEQLTVPPPRLEDWSMFMYDLRFSGKSPDRILKPPLKLR